MADIKTRDVGQGTIKTIDKAAVAGERMKLLTPRRRIKPNKAIILMKIPLSNMLQTEFQTVQERMTKKASTI